MGVILKEGSTVRGVTTPVSILVTATLGILIGIGFYVPALSWAYKRTGDAPR
ncbi:MgtC/SapB family protein [Tianweitania sediminis]|uniref:MgtC/SapB family protein n=1 Tax=Tianweitania sediminis TaxID=1502156 RepID=A0A8J7RGG9_9HYPH|nr:MgtC/SapB family protein [Tianweitania sediminis]